MKKVFLGVFLFICFSARAQVTLGFGNGISSFAGIYHELSVEVPIYKKFSLNSRVSYAINRGFMVRTGLRYNIAVTPKTNFRVGLDLGSFLETDITRDGFKQSYMLSGFNVGFEHRFGNKWGVMLEMEWMNLLRENTRKIASFPQIGVTYLLSK